MTNSGAFPFIWLSVVKNYHHHTDHLMLKLITKTVIATLIIISSNWLSMVTNYGAFFHNFLPNALQTLLMKVISFIIVNISLLPKGNFINTIFPQYDGNDDFFLNGNSQTPYFHIIMEIMNSTEKKFHQFINIIVLSWLASGINFKVCTCLERYLSLFQTPVGWRKSIAYINPNFGVQSYKVISHKYAMLLLLCI